MAEQTLEQSIAQLITKVPAPVRTFILDELSTTTDELMRRHGLHIDHAGILETELLLMLLGQSTPLEFVAALEIAGIPQEKVSAIVGDINEIFARIRKAEQTQNAPARTPVPPPSQPPVPIYSPLPTPPAPAAPPAYVTQAVERPAKQVPPPAVLPGQLPEPPAAKPVPPPPHLAVPEPTPQTAPAADPNARIIHTMSRDMQAVKSGVDPYRVAHPVPPSWASAPPKPAVAATPPPPPPPPPTPAPVTQPEKPISPPAPLPHEPLRTHLKQYGVDPYREPVE